MAMITLQQAAQWCDGLIDPKYKDVTFSGANNDSRQIRPKELFVCLEGLRDGHDYIPMAMDKGAAAVLCSRDVGDVPAIRVADPRKALGQIARHLRQSMDMKVVGITGSVGKSTTKEMVAAVLSMGYRVSKTPANHNNDLGLPMAILDMPEDTQVAVLEMGMNHFREIAYLSTIAQPDIAVITNIGTMHIEHLGSQQGILQAKLEILEGMHPTGKLLVNGDDPLLREIQHRQVVEVACFGTQGPDCQYLGRDIREEEGRICFQVVAGERQFPVELPLEGLHYVPDALAAIGVALEMGVSPEQIREAMGRFSNMAGRQEISQVKGLTIIRDCYNAGPESMSAALAVLGKKPGRRVAVLGDMLELGVCTQAEHYRVGRIAAEKADVVLAFGPNSGRIVDGALTGGMSFANAQAFQERDRIVEAMKRIVKPGDVILVKGSHGMRMEQILDKFLEEI